MSISKRSNNSGYSGNHGMSLVSDMEIKESLAEIGARDNMKNRKQKSRLGDYYKEYWDCLECSCGRCSSVFRLPKQNESGEPFTREDYDRIDFTNETLKHECPCCSQMTPLKLERIAYKGLELLRIKADVAMLPPAIKLIK